MRLLEENIKYTGFDRGLAYEHQKPIQEKQKQGNWTLYLWTSTNNTTVKRLLKHMEQKKILPNQIICDKGYLLPRMCKNSTTHLKKRFKN